MTKVDKLVEEATQAHGGARDSQSRARAAVLRALRTVEGALAKALNGEPLRGLPNLAPRGVRSYCAANLRTKFIGAQLDSGWSLVLDRSGTISVAYVGSEDIVSRPALDEEILAEDLEAVVSRIAEVLRTHNERSEQARLRYERTAFMAKRISSVAAEIFSKEPARSPVDLTVRRARRIG